MWWAIFVGAIICGVFFFVLGLYVIFGLRAIGAGLVQFCATINILLCAFNIYLSKLSQ